MSESFGIKPDRVKEAIGADDEEYLKAAGRKGGLASAQKRADDTFYRGLAEEAYMEDAERHEKEIDPNEEN